MLLSLACNGATLYEGARLITGDGSAPIEDAAFIVSDGKFTQVGNRGALSLPADIQRVNLAGKTVIPGLIDTHTHIGYDRYSYIDSDWTRNDPTGRGFFNFGAHNFTRDNILDHLSRLAYAGIVATWSAGYEFGEVPHQIRDEVLAGQHPNAARYYSAGPGITTKQAIVPYLARQSAFGVSSEAEARAAVQRLASWNVKQIKMWPHYNPTMPMNVSLALIDEAKKYDLRVGFHPVNQSDSEAYIRAGADIYLHPIYPIDSDLVKERRPFSALTSSGYRMAFFAPYLHSPDPLLADMISPFHLKKLQGKFPSTNSEERIQSKAQWDAQVSTIRDLRANGVRFALGSDAGGAGRDKPVGWSAHVDMENMVAAGFTPNEVITAATQTSAQSLRLDDLGGIAPGKEAAFVVLDANPLDDITNTRKISQVFIRGKAIDRDGLKANWRKSWGSE
ncbi:organophopsphate acid anhydrase [Agaribacter marinus]|uniref:Organophopsphate acid anhydrase n=2 Tax=Agaribacter marinus TaxID=1431249 RepID=A0AA37T2C4_9ALTE|nr:organophopsphate acid anhydrase [Agaribacter marinus]